MIEATRAVLDTPRACSATVVQPGAGFCSPGHRPAAPIPRGDAAEGVSDALLEMLRTAVGQIGVRDLEGLVRSTMVAEAIGRTGGNRRAAARLLGVSRQHLQHMLRALAPEGATHH